MIQCHEDLKKRFQIMHRDVLVQHSLTATGYNYALQPKSDAYFLEVLTEGGATIKTAPSFHQGIVDTLDISITKGGGNLHNPSSPSPQYVGMFQPIVVPIETVLDNPGNLDVVPVTDNRGDVNEEGASDYMDWSTMVQEGVQYRLNDADKLDICPIDILSCY